MQKTILSGIALFIAFTLHAQHTSPYYADKKIQVLELRNYVLKEGGRDNFIDSFKIYIEDSQNVKGAYVLGLYRVKEAATNFYWFRGYENMPLRKKAMEDFYASSYWASITRIPQQYVINFHDVHLLKPYDITTGDSTSGFPAAWFDKPKGVAVVDFYTGNGTRAKVIDYVSKTYHTLLLASGVKDISYWIAEDQPNNYPRHPVFQDSNSLVSIAFYKNENEYKSVMKKLASKMNAEMRNYMRGVFTLHSHVILYNAE